MYWLYVIILGVVAGVAFDLVLALVARNISKKKKVTHLEIKKIKIHHSCVGILCIFLSFFFLTLPLLSFAIGEIISHSLREKSLLFIEIKDKRIF